jgi:hypothetical protein
MSDQYILVDCQESISHLNGGRFWRMVFVSLADGTQHEMTVDPAYTNFKRSGWNHIVADPYPYGVYTGLKRTKKTTKRGIPVVSADGKARLIYRCENDEELARLVEANERSFETETVFGQLFEAGTNYGKTT